MASARRKSAAIALAVVGIAGLSLASAAQLNIASASLGAGTQLVATCDTNGVTVGFETAYAAGKYDATSVVINGIADTCAGQNIAITLTDAAGVVVGQVAKTTLGGVVGGGDFSFTNAVTPYDAALITGVSIVIYG